MVECLAQMPGERTGLARYTLEQLADAFFFITGTDDY
jgi:hypothetical protein